MCSLFKIKPKAGQIKPEPTVESVTGTGVNVIKLSMSEVFHLSICANKTKTRTVSNPWETNTNILFGLVPSQPQRYSESQDTLDRTLEGGYGRGWLLNNYTQDKAKHIDKKICIFE